MATALCRSPRLLWSPETSTNGSDMEVSGLLSLSVTTKENNMNVKKRTWISRVPSKVVSQSWHPDTGTALHDERPPVGLLDVSDMKVSDEDGFLFLNMKIKTNSAIMKERIWINRVTNEIVFQTVAFRCTMSVSLQFERSRFGTLNSTTEMSQMECCHPGNFQVTWSHRFFRSRSKLRRNLSTRCSLVVR